MAIQDVPAPMTGTVKELLVAVGDQVNVGQEIVIIESMKMEIPVVVEAPGVVAEISVAPGDVVREGDVIAILL